MTGFIVKGIITANQVLEGLKTKVESIHSDERGVTAVEYALIVGLIAIVIIGAVTLLGTSVSNLFARARCAVVGGVWTAATNTCSI
ncbi:MAG: Flp family type IVb pilin [Candidatus Planktophila sp.]|nr:Flp family type IVb pilin [Candidatus Planktophila sp.]